MLYKAQTLTGYALQGIDGEIGTVKEFYFDDQHWTIRYLIAETGTWLADRQVLISPYALTGVKTEERHITVNLTRKQIEDSPAISNDKPVSRQFEDHYYKYFGWPIYYGGSLDHHKKTWNPGLRSTKNVSKYYIQASDGEIGHVEDFIIDDKAWAIRYLVINTRNWLPGKKVLVSPQWIERVSWQEEKVFVGLSLELIKKSPEYSEEFLLNRDYEAQLHKHYNRPGYWGDMPAAGHAEFEESMTNKTGLAKEFCQESPGLKK
ncbi:MAG: photosystem reaction center subunit H [Candidatus Riflebacteria bacterium HGW-Riflebacteria-2]|jgi:sporulation protein YlmC with PRC-barrel domain|nr:MAG: photosystem reaction center subunit H [Candidatus Riflebacteria bacterium HGW-Riflebacteria-2]